MVHELLRGAREGGGAGQEGATLAELIVVTVVVSIAALAFSGMFVEAVRSYHFLDVEKELLQEARYAEERISRELRRVRNASSVTTAATTTFAFVDRNSAEIAISWDGTKGSPLVYARDGSPRALAAGVDSFALAYFKSDGTPAAPIVAPSSTDIWRVTMFLRLSRDGQSVDVSGAAFVRVL